MKWKMAFLIGFFATPLLSLDFDGQWVDQKIPLKKAVEFERAGTVLNIQANGAVSILYRPVFQTHQGASWEWRVKETVPATNLRAKGGDDRNLAIYFVFMPEAEAETVRGQGIAKVLRNSSAKALVYTYGGQDGRGASFQNPYMQGRGVSIVHAAAGVGSGQESVNLSSDFTRAFGAEMGVLVGVGITADSDDTNSVILAQISKLQLK